MKFAVLLVTRGNPHKAAAVMECARSLSSGKHEIEFVIGCDSDDPAQTYAYFRREYLGLRVSVEERVPGIGAVWNRCARLVDADVYCPFPDDSFIGVPCWDELIAVSMEAAFPVKELGVLAWNDTANPGQCTLPIVTREWLALSGQLYDERFPFWFYDTCVDELWSFVTGRNIPIIPDLKLVARRGLTQRMRDLPFWWDFCVSTRRERLLKAAEIRATLGIDLSPSALACVIMNWSARDAQARQSLQEIEATLAVKSEPSKEYLVAKASAESLMAA